MSFQKTLSFLVAQETPESRLPLGLVWAGQVNLSILSCIFLRSADLTPPLAPVRDSGFYVGGWALLCPPDLEKWLGQQHHFSGLGAKEGLVLVWGNICFAGPSPKKGS